MMETQCKVFSKAPLFILLNRPFFIFVLNSFYVSYLHFLQTYPFVSRLKVKFLT